MRFLKILPFIVGGQVGQMGADNVFPLGSDVGHDFLFIVGFGFPCLDVDGAQRAGADAGPKAVAEKIGHQSGLAVDKLQRPFGAIGQAEAAAVAQLMVNIDYFSFQFSLLAVF